MENFVPRSPVLFDDDDSSGVSSNQVALDADEIDAVAANVTDGVDTYESLLAAVTITDIPPTLRSLESAVTVEEIPTTLQSLENAVTVEVNFPTVQSLESAVTVEEISPTIEKLLDEVTLESVSQSRSLASSPATDSPAAAGNVRKGFKTIADYFYAKPKTKDKPQIQNPDPEQAQENSGSETEADQEDNDITDGSPNNTSDEFETKPRNDSRNVIIIPNAHPPKRKASSSSSSTDLSDLVPGPRLVIDGLNDGEEEPRPRGRRKRSKPTIPTDEDFTQTKYKCPGCDESLDARYWQGKGFYSQRTEVATPEGFILIKTAVDQVLPCVKCYAAESGIADWRETTNDDGKVLNFMQNRLRQHVYQKHKLKATDPEAVSMREHGKQLVCLSLHDKKSQKVPENLSLCNVTLELPPDRPSIKSLAHQLRLGALPLPAQEWLTWLKATKQIQPATVKLYTHHISQLLLVARLIFPTRKPSLMFAWNVPFVQEFLDVIRELVCPSTFQNYYSSLVAVRRFLTKTGRKPENYAEINEDFADMRKAGQRKKTKYLKRQKEKRKKTTSNLLQDYYRKVYHGDFLWNLFNSLVERSRQAIKDGKTVPRITRGEMFFANCHIIQVMQSCNYKRSGNFGRINCEESKAELQRALSVFQAKFPDRPFVSGSRRLDRRFCVPALLCAENGTKKDEVEWIPILNPRDIQAIYFYILYIRNYGRHPPTTDTLLVNSRGESLNLETSKFLKAIGKTVGVDKLGAIELRSCIETENVATPDESSLASLHLGHTERTRDEFYILPDKRRFIKASNRLLYLLEEAGESDDASEVHIELCDPAMLPPLIAEATQVSRNAVSKPNVICSPTEPEPKESQLKEKASSVPSGKSPIEPRVDESCMAESATSVPSKPDPGNSDVNETAGLTIVGENTATVSTLQTGFSPTNPCEESSLSQSSTLYDTASEATPSSTTEHTSLYGKEGRDTADSLLDAMMLSPGSPRTKTQTEDKIVVNKNDKTSSPGEDRPEFDVAKSFQEILESATANASNERTPKSKMSLEPTWRSSVGIKRKIRKATRDVSDDEPELKRVKLSDLIGNRAFEPTNND